MSERASQELSVAIGLLGLEFVFLTLMMDIPRGDILFNQTITFYLPFYYAVSLPTFIQSCIWISSSVLITSIIFYLSTYSIKNDPENLKKSKLQKVARCVLYIGSYYWMLLFISALFIYNIKFQTITENYEISGIYFLLVIFGPIMIHYVMFNDLLPKTYDIQIYYKDIKVSNLKYVIFLGHLLFWGILWSDIVTYLIPTFHYFTPFHIQFSSSLLLILILLIIALIDKNYKIREPVYKRAGAHMNSKKWMYLSLGILLAIIVLIDLAYPQNDLVQKYIPNLVTEIFGIFFVVAYVDRLLTNERKRENERFQGLERIKTVGINIRSLPDDQVKQLEAEFEKLWELGVVGGRESKEAIMSQLHQISFFALNEKNKLMYLIKAVQKQFLELVGPEHIPFNENWKEDLILEGLDIIDFVCEISGYIYNKEFFTQVQDTIQYFIDIAIDYKKEKIASKCFNTIENIEKYAIEKIDNGKRAELENVTSIITGHFSTMKDAMYEKIKQKNYGWNVK